MTAEHTSNSSGNTRKKRSRIRFLLLLFLGFFLLLAGIAVGGAYYVCVYKPELVASLVQGQLSAMTGLPWRINGSVMPSFSGSPGFSATQVSILAATEEQSGLALAERPLVTAQEVRLALDLQESFAAKKPVFTSIDLIAPVISLTYDQEGRALWLPLPSSDGSSPVFNIFSQQEKTAVAPGEGENSVPVAEEPEKHDPLYAFACEIRDFSSSSLVPLRIQGGSLIGYTREGERLLSFSDVQAEIIPGSEPENLRFSALFVLPGADLSVEFSVKARLCEAPVLIGGTLQGTVSMTPPGSRTIRGDFISSFNWAEGGKDIHLPDFAFTAEGDSLKGDLTFNVDTVQLTGPVAIERISLPRWFMFGRVVPPGLSEVLHTVTGTFDLYLDSGTAQARNLKCIASSGHVVLEGTGYVGTESFAHPVVKVDVTLPQANVDPVFPFLAAVGSTIPQPIRPEFDHPPLAPYPERDDEPEPPEPDEPHISVGYDINIHVTAPTVHSLKIGPSIVRVLPTEYKDDTIPRVTIEATDVLKGSAKGEIDVTEDGILMRYQASGMDLGLLPENQGHAAQMTGIVTGTCEIDMPVVDGHAADDWRMRIDAAVKNYGARQTGSKNPWYITAANAKWKGEGPIHAVLEDGVRIEGGWNFTAQSIKTSWHPQGKDKLSGSFKGGFFWPPIVPEGPAEPGKKRRIQRKSVRNITGTLTLDGGLVTPLASARHPVQGTLSTQLDWRVHDDKLILDKSVFKGFGSIIEGKLDVDFSGKETTLASDATFKVNPQEVLRRWNIAPPDKMRIPGLLTGRADISGKSGQVLFDKLKVEIDGAPVTGRIAWKERGAASGHWDIQLSAEHFDFDNILPQAQAGIAPAPPVPQAKWDLRFLEGLSLDAKIFLNSAKRQGLTFSRTKITATLERDRFSFYSETENFYDGTATFVIQGSFVPQKSQIVVRQALSQMNNISLGKTLYDFTKSTSYGGKADVIFDVNGTLTSEADIPAQLSGIWSLNIKDGIYPSLWRKQDSGMRNSFSTASASGLLDKGVLRWKNFVLSGPMVDMSGNGWVNLALQSFDIEVSVTFAKVPTVPVRFYGNAQKPLMKVRGVDMVLETVQAAGGTVFNLVIGVLELPGNAISGIISIFGGDD